MGFLCALKYIFPIVWAHFGSADIINKFCPINPTIGYSARSNQDPVVQFTGEVTLLPDRAIILSLGASEFQSKPYPRCKVCRTDVPDGPHFVGAGQKDLGAFMQLHWSLGVSCSGAAPAAP